MCGRFALFAGPEELARAFGVTIEDVALPPRYNIAPTQTVAVVRVTEASRQVVPMRWGLSPWWAKDPAIGNRMINARAETLREKPAFRSAFKARRCLIPASGFYEWAGTGRARQPYYSARRDGAHAATCDGPACGDAGGLPHRLGPRSPATGPDGVGAPASFDAGPRSGLSGPTGTPRRRLRAGCARIGARSPRGSRGGSRG
jgi:hypothetical protein